MWANSGFIGAVAFCLLSLVALEDASYGAGFRLTLA